MTEQVQHWIDRWNRLKPSLTRDMVMFEHTIAWLILALILSTRWFDSSIVREYLHLTRWILTVILVLNMDVFPVLSLDEACNSFTLFIINM